MAEGQQHRYHFNQRGIVKDIVYPNKAILDFRLNGSGSENRAILLTKVLTLDGKAIEENRLMQDILKVNDIIHFDCHVYDRGPGGMGSGKDRCNFYAMKAWKNSADYELRNGSGTSGGLIGLNSGGGGGASMVSSVGNCKVGTGWVSELTHPRKGVLTFDNNGKDERVLFLASRVYFFEKKIGSKQPLSEFLSEGDPVQFEAVPNSGNDEDGDGSGGGGSSGGGGGGGACANNSYCSWFANLIWKGKRPNVDTRPLIANSAAAAAAIGFRRNSCDSSSDGELNGGGGGGDEYVSYGTRYPCNPDIVKGVGMIGKIVNEKAGVIWWAKSYNEFHSVWFTSNKTFLFGTNLANKNLSDIFSEGDPVSLVAEKASSLNCPTKWIAKQVMISDDTADLLQKATEPPDSKKPSM